MRGGRQQRRALPRLGHAQILVPRRGQIRPLGAARAFRHLGPPARVAERGGAAFAHRPPRGLHPRGIPAHLQLPPHRAEHPPHRGPCRPLCLFQRRRVPHRAGDAGRFFQKRSAARHLPLQRGASALGERRICPHTAQQRRRAQRPCGLSYVPQAAWPQVVQPQKWPAELPALAGAEPSALFHRLCLPAHRRGLRKAHL